MKQIKFAILGAGVIGLIAIFLPYISILGQSLKFWDFRKDPNAGAQPVIALVGYLLATGMAGLAVATKGLRRWHAIVALLGFGLAFLTKGVRSGMSYEGVSTAIGGKLLFIAAVVGLIAAVAGAAKPEPKA
jgi:hypothetical protein